MRARAAAAAATTSSSTSRHRARATVGCCCTPPRTVRCPGTSPTAVPPRPRPTRAVSGGRYRIPRAVVPVDEREPAETRGILGAIGKKVLKVLVFPLVDPILGKVGDHFAKRWEAKNRLNRVRWMTVDGYRSSVADPFADADWARLGEGARSCSSRHLLHRARRVRKPAPHHHDRAARGVRRPRRLPGPPQRLRHAEGERRAARRAGPGRRCPRGRPGHALARRVGRPRDRRDVGGQPSHRDGSGDGGLAMPAPSWPTASTSPTSSTGSPTSPSSSPTTGSPRPSAWCSPCSNSWPSVRWAVSTGSWR